MPLSRPTVAREMPRSIRNGPSIPRDSFWAMTKIAVSVSPCRMSRRASAPRRLGRGPAAGDEAEPRVVMANQTSRAATSPAMHQTAPVQPIRATMTSRSPAPIADPT